MEFEAKIHLPPLIESFDNGQAKWKAFDSVDFELVGLFLSCHLVIEHYMDEFLEAYSPAPFDWESAKLTFAQKVSLISGLKQFPEPFTIPAVLKHFNSIRNKLSHSVTYKLSSADLLPEIQFLGKANKEKLKYQDFDVKKILEHFTSIVCVYFASAITHCAEQRHNGLNGVWKL